MQKGFITPAVVLIIGTLLAGVPLAAWYTATPEPQVAEDMGVGGFGDPFLSIQLATDPDSGECLTTDGTDNAWSTCASGGGGSISTSTTPTPGQVAYWTSTSALGSVATGTLTTNATGLSFDATRGLLGGAAVLSLDAGRTIPLTASTTEWDTAYANNHAAVTLAGEDFLSLSTQQITANPINEDNLNLNAPTDNYLLVASSTASGGFEWVATSTARLGLSSGGGSGTVTSVDMTVPTGLAISGNPITTSGTLALDLDTGYVIPLSASTTEWAAAHASTTALTPAYIRGLFSGTSPVSYNSGTGAFGITADAIGDTELTFNTGQHLTTTSAPTFASSTFSNLTSAVLLTTAGGLLQEYAGTACTNQFVRSLSALAAATCAAVNLTSDVTGILPIANGGTGTSTAPTTGQVLLGNAAGSYDLVATSSLGITASAGGANTQIQYNSGGALAGLSTLTTDGSSLTMTGTSTLATTTISQLTVSGASTFTDTATFGADIIGPGFCDTTTASNCLILNSTSATLNVGAGDYFQFNSSENNADAYFSTDNATYTLFVDGGTDRVGIGTSTPGSLLTVDGSALFTGETHLGSNLFVGENMGFTMDNAYLYWGDESTLIAGNSTNDFLSFYTNGTEQLTITSTGNVGIGTTTPGSLLTVTGTSTLATTTTSRLTVSNITSALGLFDSSGLLTEYTGASCTNQVLTVLSASGAGTCASINNAYWSGTDLSVANGGTGASSLTDHGVLVGSGTGAVTPLAVGTNGQILVGSTGADPVFASLNCADGLTCTTGAGTLEIDFDGGNSPGGVLGGTWASPTLDAGIVGTTTLTATGYTAGDVLIASSTASGGWTWVATSTLGISGGGGGIDVQVFTSSGTWNKPASGDRVLVQAWGAGGSGGGSDVNRAGGGGGGGYSEAWFDIDDLASSETVTIGAGGTGVGGGSGVDGNVGGNTTFGSHLTAYGGGGGAGQNDGGLGGGGGGGGGTLGAGASVTGEIGGNGGRPQSSGAGNGGAANTAGGDNSAGGGGGGGADTTGTAGEGGYSYSGGGGGGGGSGFGRSGGNSHWGGGGGGGYGGAGSGGGGTSVMGGNGSGGGSSSSSNGSQPGGGSGGVGSGGGNSGAGGAGQVIVTVF